MKENKYLNKLKKEYGITSIAKNKIGYEYKENYKFKVVSKSKLQPIEANFIQEAMGFTVKNFDIDNFYQEESLDGYLSEWLCVKI